MEAKELQIGDWVRVDDTENPYPLIVTEIYRKSTSYCVHLINNEYNEDITCVADRVWAIPLTENILKANGWYERLRYSQLTILSFEQENIGIDYTIYDCNRCTHHHKSCLNIYVKLDSVYINHIELYDISSVHQLQHALRLCGLDDLADNFKIAD